MVGGVYFVRGADLIKIGFSESIGDRFRQLECGSPVPLELIGYLPDVTIAVEQFLHRRFADARSHGEWFRPTDELVAFATGGVLPATLTDRETAERLGITAAVVRRDLEVIAWPIGRRGGLRWAQPEVEAIAALVEEERVVRRARAVLREALAAIDPELATAVHTGGTR